MSEEGVTATDLRAFDLFAEQSDEDLAALASWARRRRLDDREILVVRGESRPWVAWVVSGRISLAVDHEGRSVMLETLGPGDMLGWSMLREDPVALATARAVGPAEIVEVPAERLLDAATTGTSEARHLVRRLIGAAAGDLEASRAQLLRVGREGIISAG